MGIVQSWNDLEKGLKPNVKKYHGTCDEHCEGYKHSPGCALRTMINSGERIYRAIQAIEESIEFAVVASDNTAWANQRRYDPYNASKEEIKRYKHLMTLLKEAVFEYCDCGAKHDGAGHYHWCSTQRRD